MSEFIAFMMIGGLLTVLWRSGVEARGVAFDAARAACERDGLQLLDGTVVFKSWRTGRGAGGRLALYRTYLFDYSDDGASRRQGFVVLRGQRIEIVGLGPTLVAERRA